jgi:hypothetical protein
MNARAHRPLARHHSRQARRARRLEEETVVCLSAMDSKLLNDIGMDIGTLGDLANENAANDAANTIVTLPQRSNRRKRS